MDLFQKVNLSVCASTRHGDLWGSESKSLCIQYKTGVQIRNLGQQLSVTTVYVYLRPGPDEEKIPATAGNGTPVVQPTASLFTQLTQLIHCSNLNSFRISFELLILFLTSVLILETYRMICNSPTIITTNTTWCY